MATTPSLSTAEGLYGIYPQDSAPPQKADPTPSNPQKGKPEDIEDTNGLNKKDRENLMTIRRLYKEQWTMVRRVYLRNMLRKMEYLKGNQYYVVGPDGFTFQDPFQSQAGSQGSEQGKDQDVYKYVTNIIQWFERVLVKTIGVTPNIRFQPANAASDIGNRVAQHASRANAYVERMNDEPVLTKQKVSYLSLCGSYFVYTRPVRDSRLSGDKTEVIPDEAMEERQVSQDRYACPQCGEETPLDQMAVESKLQCKFCGAPVSEADFFPGEKLPMPVMKQGQPDANGQMQGGTKEVPQMQVRKSLYTGLQVDAAPNADCETGDPLLHSPILDLSVEIDIGMLRAMYPDMWDELAGGGDASGSGDNEVDRITRLMAVTQNTGAAWWTRSSGIITQGDMPTFSRTWYNPESFNKLPDRAQAKRLAGLFPKGCCVSSWNGNYLDVRPCTLSEEWTWCGTRRGFGLYPPAILEPAMDFQDQINDSGNTESEYYDRMAVPGVAYDSTAITGKGLNGRYWSVGTWFPIRVKPKEGRTLQNVLWQPQFHMDKGISEYRQRLILMAQMTAGITPQMWGGSQTNIETSSGQKQALQTATGISELYWEEVRGEAARTAKNAVKCLVRNATQDVFNVVKGDDNRYSNEPIDLNALKNDFEAYPDTDQGFPATAEQQRQVWQQLILEGAQNPMVLSLFDSMRNQRMAARVLLPQDVEIPDEKYNTKVLEDLVRMKEGRMLTLPAPPPMPGMPPAPPIQIPSIQPTKYVDNMAICQKAAQDYLEENFYAIKEEDAQKGTDYFQQIIAYIRLAAQFQKEMAMEMSPPPGLAPGGPPPRFPSKPAPLPQGAAA
jgi:hypothetical protein